MVEDEPMGSKERRSSVLSAIEEAAIVAPRVQARLPLDDVDQVVAAPPAYLAAAGSPSTPQDLLGHRRLAYLYTSSGAIHRWS